MRSEIDTDRHFHYRSIHQTQTHCHRHRNSTTSPSRYGRRYGGWLASMMAALTLLQRVADKPMHRRNTDHSNATTRHHLQHIHAGRFLSQHYSVVRHYRHHLYLWWFESEVLDNMRVDFGLTMQKGGGFTRRCHFYIDSVLVRGLIGYAMANFVECWQHHLSIVGQYHHKQQSTGANYHWEWDDGMRRLDPKRIQSWQQECHTINRREESEEWGECAHWQFEGDNSE